MRNKNMTLFFCLCGICIIGICVGMVISYRVGLCAKEAVSCLGNLKELTLSLKDALLNDIFTGIVLVVLMNIIPISPAGIFMWGGLAFFKGALAGFSYFQLFFDAGFITALKIAVGVVLPSLIMLVFMCHIGIRFLFEERKNGKFAKMLNRSYYTVLFAVCVCIRCVIQYGLFYKL